MQNCHSIPKFILRGFVKNPSAKEINKKVMILDTETLDIRTELISKSFAIDDFYSEDTEKILAYQYEGKAAKIFQKIKTAAERGEY